MDLEDLFKHKHHNKHAHRQYDDHDHTGYHGDKHGEFLSYGGHHHGHYKLEMIRSLLKALPHKKALLTAVLGIGCLMLIIGIAILWAIFPLIIKAVEYVEINGIKGIIDSVLPYVQKLWEGSGK
jgi:hypothetical protein